MDDASSIGQASAAVAMANDAIDNARRAAASSRSRRAAQQAAAGYSASGGQQLTTSYSGAAGAAAGIQTATEMDLKNNDNAYHVIATLVTERLLPKVVESSTHYTLTAEDTAFFQKMLPYSVRRSFVDALRYRLQLYKSGVGSRNSSVGKLSMQCQMLGLDRENLNVLLDLSSSAGMSYPINYKNQGPVAVPSPKETPSTTAYDQYNNNAPGTQQSKHYNINTSTGDNGVTFGLNSPMAFSPDNTFSPTNNNDGHDNNNTNFGLDPSQVTMSNNEWETSAESLARQQIMAEINETKVLMKGSVTPDAVNFWKKHLEELSQRLVALSLEEQLKAAGSAGGASAGGMMGGGQGMGLGNDTFGDRSNKNYNNNNNGPPQMQQQEDYMENNRRMREEMGLGAVVSQPGNGGGGGGGYSSPRHHHHGDHIDAVASMPRKQLDELPVCDVVAPSDLPGGYMFEAQLGSKKFLATVPPGGVTKGQRFVSTMQELETIEIPVPLGAWRDGIKDCFNDGVCHPLFLNTLFFPCVALGQIMTRTGLDWQGKPSNRLVSSLSCANMTVLLTFWLAMNASAAFMLRVAWERGRLMEDEPDYYIVLIIFNLLVLAYMVNLTRKVRESIRNKYQIPEENCEGIEDCLCATFCMPCAICQMGRHTADFDTYRATCCTKTGLPRQVELAPVTFYEDQYQNMNDESQMMA